MKKDEEQTVQLVNTKNNIASQYIQHAKSWDSTDEWDEQAKFMIPKDI